MLMFDYDELQSPIHLALVGNVINLIIIVFDTYSVTYCSEGI